MSATIERCMLNPTDPGSPFLHERHQLKFATSPASDTFLAGGWGSGKSCALASFIAISAFYNPPRTDGILAMPTYAMIDNFMYRIFMPMLGDLIVHYQKSKPGIVYLRGERRLICLSGHIPDRIESYTACYAGVDEPGLMHRSIMPRLAARRRDPKATWARTGYTGVPVWGWLRDEFEGRSDRGRKIIHCSTHSNIHLRQSDVDHMLDSCPASMRDAYIFGKFTPPGFRVWHVFNRDRHCIPYEFQRNTRSKNGGTLPVECGVVIDPSANCPAVVFVAIMPVGAMLNGREIKRETAIVFDELHPGGRGEHVQSERLASMILAKNYPLNFCYMDPAGKAVEATSTRSQMQIIGAELGLRVEYETSPELRSIVNGVEMVSRMLDPLTGDPALYFAKKMLDNKDQRGCINSLENYAYPKGKGDAPMTSSPHKDGITDHMADCVRYLAINRFPVQRLAVRIWNAA